MSPAWQAIRGFRWRWILPAYGVFGIFLFLYGALDRVARDEPVEWWIVFLEEMTGAASALVVLPAISWLTLSYPLTGDAWRRRWPLYLAGGALIGLVQTTCVYGLRLAVFGVAGLGVYDYGHMPVRYLMEMPIELILFAGVVTGVSYWDHRRLARERERRVEALERQLTEAQLEALRLQLHPHFLFNALNVISTAVYEDPRRADRMIVKLSDLLRRVLRSDARQETPLREELELLELYVDVMRARLEDRLTCTVDVEAGLEGSLVPQLILQPLVENALRYGADPETGAVDVSVRAGAKAGKLSLEVCDRGPGVQLQRENGFGVGLENLSSRLERLYGPEARLQVDRGRLGVSVRVTIPLHTAPVIRASSL